MRKHDSHGACAPGRRSRGSPGIGLFIVPKIWVNDDGSLGKPNDVTTAGIEHKTGLHAHATALLNFGDEEECRGILVRTAPRREGAVQRAGDDVSHDEQVRIGTGHNANNQAAAAYYFASQFATERIQGRPFGVKGAGRCAIIKHEDVRRMLLDMKAHVEGIRAMIFKGFYWLDIQSNSSDKALAKKYGEFAEVLTPLVKCYGSEASLGLISEAIQVLGGVGYTQESPVEQYLRDSKILSIWEGTSFIHGNDLVGRKMRMKEGSSFTNWMATIKGFIDANATAEGFEKEMAGLARGYQCLVDVKATYDAWFADMATKRSLIPLYAIRALFVCAQVQVAECLMEQALIAKQKLAALPADAFDATFYRGKIASARYYVHNVLPNAFLATEMIQKGDDSVLTCPEEALVVN